VTTILRLVAPVLITLLAAGPLHTAAASDQDLANTRTVRVSVANDGSEANGRSYEGSITSDGRYVVFSSEATNLVTDDQNLATDVFLRKIPSGATTLVSTHAEGISGNAASFGAKISQDGSRVAFLSYASDLVLDDANNSIDVFMRDLNTNAVQLASVSSSGAQGNALSTFVDSRPALSANGRFIAFSSTADNLVPDDTNDREDVFVRDTVLGTTVRASVSSTGAESNGSSWFPSVSADGRYVAFATTATTLIDGQATPSYAKVALHDLVIKSTALVSRNDVGEAADAPSIEPAISADGRSVVFASSASNLSPGVTGQAQLNVYLRDLQSATTRMISSTSSGLAPNGQSRRPSPSSNASTIAFASLATNLGPLPDLNEASDVFTLGVMTSCIQRQSTGPSGLLGLGASGLPSISSDGRSLVFQSTAPDLIVGDTNGESDVFFRRIA
jgi:Tol biopolymer transport system component